MTSLLAKARALEVEGVTTFLFSGSYGIPVDTLTGSVRGDLVLIDKVIGAGEIALSDHRSSQPTFDEVARLAAECRVGGMLGGKAGVLHLHVGDGKRRLEMLFRLVRETEIPATQVVPTHMTRNRELFEEGLEWVKAGGAIDVTAGPDPDPASDPDVSLEECVARFKKDGLPLARLMVSSDANGSMPVFDKAGRLVRLTIATERDLFRKFRDLVAKGVLPLEEAARLFSTNAAEFYRLRGKGRIASGGRAPTSSSSTDATSPSRASSPRADSSWPAAGSSSAAPSVNKQPGGALTVLIPGPAGTVTLSTRVKVWAVPWPPERPRLEGHPAAISATEGNRDMVPGAGE